MIAVDAVGNVYIAGDSNRRVRRISTTGIISTVAGNGTCGFSGDGGPATEAAFDGVLGIAADAAGNLYIADSNNNRIRRVSPADTIATVAGNGDPGLSGDNGRRPKGPSSGPTHQ